VTRTSEPKPDQNYGFSMFFMNPRFAPDGATGDSELRIRDISWKRFQCGGIVAGGPHSRIQAHAIVVTSPHNWVRHRPRAEPR
jgi:hypothetical protein